MISKICYHVSLQLCLSCISLKKAGLSVDDIDIFEINEAFASQVKGAVKTFK